MLAAGNPVLQYSRSLLGEIGYTAAHTRHIQVLNNTLQWWSAAGELVSVGWSLIVKQLERLMSMLTPKDLLCCILHSSELCHYDLNQCHCNNQRNKVGN